MLKIKVKISETKFLSFYKTLILSLITASKIGTETESLTSASNSPQQDSDLLFQLLYYSMHYGNETQNMRQVWDVSNQIKL